MIKYDKMTNSNKKAQSISINTIIVAAIALVVMILVILIFTNSITNFRKQSGQCEANGGSCLETNSVDKTPDKICSRDQFKVIKNEYSCCADNEKNCKKICCVST